MFTVPLCCQPVDCVANSNTNIKYTKLISTQNKLYICASNAMFWSVSLHIDGLQHKGIMSTKPLFEKITKIQRSYIPLCGRTTFMLLTITSACTMTFIDKITIFWNYVNKTSTFVELLAINILCYMS